MLNPTNPLRPIYRLPVTLLLIALAGCVPRETETPTPIDPLALHWDGLRGQVEVGGPFAGVEFHDSRPLPARISFYYPVANSIDLSTDYWERGASKPWSVLVKVDGQTEDLGDQPAPYTWAPHRVTFHRKSDAFDADVSYRFAEDLPLFAFELVLVNRKPEPASFEVSSRLNSTLRTSHAYTIRQATGATTLDDGSAYVAEFDAPDTDSARVFVVNAALTPIRTPDGPANPSEASFDYAATLAPGDTLRIVQLVGSTSRAELTETVQRAGNEWTRSVAKYEQRVSDYAHRDRLRLPDDAILRTARMAKALLQANRHFLDGRLMPMPCPAEYNFFFTHDLFQTNLGAVRFDVARVKSDFELLLSLSDSTHILPHAYYWRDGAYLTEWAGSDNWNHLWFVILAGSYLHHSGDTALVERLYPMLRKSLDLMLTNERDGLMYAFQPDWWDIGHVYGARSYLGILTVRALESFVSLSLRLGKSPDDLTEPLARSRRLRQALGDQLWDEQSGYLLNQIDATETDRHLYSGSLLAAPFGLLDARRMDLLLETAGRELLDRSLGIRNVMPADFHELTDRYRFNGPEVGGPYLYLNGGIWPQGSAWYALGLLAARRPNEAREVVYRTLSLEGMIASPNGQPAFYEYRRADPSSPRYGEVDKPTFLWAGGWFLHLTYGLMGVRENAWNLSFESNLPDGYEGLSYDLAIEGSLAEVSVTGTGSTFRRILVDGRATPSAVLSGPARRIELVRGPPETPYLASATVRIDGASYDRSSKTLRLDVSGVAGQEFRVELVSALAYEDARPTNLEMLGITEDGPSEEGATRWVLDARLDAHKGGLEIIFR